MSNTSGLPPSGRRWNRPHWISLDAYLTLHASYMETLERRLGIEDGLSISNDGSSSIVISGRISCQHSLFVDVHKTLDLREDGMVCGNRYKYQACRETGSQTHELFRYDNARHERPHPGHRDPFHKHTVEGQVEWIGIESWPTLFQVIEELHEWWEESGRHIYASEPP